VIILNKLEQIQTKFTAFELQRIAKSDFLTTLHQAIIKGDKGTPLEIIVNSIGFSIHKPTYTILDRGDHSTTIEEIMRQRFNDEMARLSKCPKCNRGMDSPLMLLHLTSDLMDGHSLDLFDTLKAYTDIPEE